MKTEQVNFAEKKAQARRMDVASLMWSIKDAQAAERANPTGPKAGYYLDEVHVFAEELRRRRNGKAKFIVQYFEKC